MRKYLLTTLLIVITGAWTLQAQTYGQLLGQDDEVNTITTAVPFLLISPDSRSGAMGDVGVASSPDAHSQHWNAAKYPFIDDEMGVSISYSPWLPELVNDIDLSYVSAYYKLDKMQTISMSLRYFSLGEITFTNRVGESMGQFKPNEFAVDAAYSRLFSDNWSGAVVLRYINSNLTSGQYVNGAETQVGQSIAADVAVYHQSEVDLGERDGTFAFGANISNIGAKISYSETLERDFIPINMRIGAALTTELDNYNKISIMADFNKLLVPTPPVYRVDSNGAYKIAKGEDPNRSVVAGMLGSFSDAPGGFEEELREITAGVGLEYWYDNQFALRGGYFYEHETKGNRKYFTMGVGFKYNVLGLDFSYLIPVEQRNPMENTLRFTLRFNFESFQNQQNN
ncbi:MAG: type IX secretion system outer membrane channel protein PorV [Bacteroidales bacterium]|nr:type IX secretion system outer membrane channel protein PorV [Bacteroidales bacterium]MCF8326692.1 type IX secretion system outer membrane channel protein PorV [Bacteroidales bacterium]